MTDEEMQPIDEEIGMGTVDKEQARVFQEEAVRVVEAGKQQGVTLRIIGALAFHNHCPEFGYFQEKMNRVYTDIDFAGYGKQSKQIGKLFKSIGYDEVEEIDAFHAEGGRLIFNNPSIPLHVDVFMDKLDLSIHLLEGPPRSRRSHDPAGGAPAREDADRQDQREGHHRHHHAAA